MLMLKHACQLAVLILCCCSAQGSDDEAQANGYDHQWQALWVSHAQELLASASGKTTGLVLMIGDSITHFSYNAIWPQQGAGKTASDQQVLSWCHAAAMGAGENDATSENGWYLSTASTSGNRGMTASAGIDSEELLSGSGMRGNPMPLATSTAGARSLVQDGVSYPFNLNVGTVVSAFPQAQFAICEVGTNDVNVARSASAYQQNIARLVALLESNHIVPILCTLPPRPDAYTNGLITGYNQALYAFAQSHDLALIDFHAEILSRRPGTSWEGTLIGAGDVHPTHAGAGYDCTSDPYIPGGDPATGRTGDACMNVGFLLRSWLLTQKLKQVSSLVVTSPGGYGTDGWLNEGHDARRTGVSGGRAIPPWSLLWHYRPTPTAFRHLQFVTHVTASASGLFVGWAEDDQLGGYDPYDTGSVAMDAVTVAGQTIWSYDSVTARAGAVRNLAHWPTASDHFVWQVDDGLFRWPFGAPQRVDPLSVRDASSLWGDVTWQNHRLYAINGLHADGQGIELACWNEDTSMAWKSVLSYQGNAPQNVSDGIQGLAVDATMVVYAPHYYALPGQRPPFGMGIYAFDAQRGSPLYSVGCAPLGKLSIGGGRIYLLESLNSRQYLTARKQSTGALLWQVQVVNGSRQAPVLFADKVVYASEGHLAAYRPADGSVIWTVAMHGATIPDESLNLGPAPSVPSWSPLVRGQAVGGFPTFHLLPSTAVAGCSSTLGSSIISSVVVASGLNITVLDAASGALRGVMSVDTMPGGPTSIRDPIIVGNRVYVVTDHDDVLAFAGQ